MKNNKLQAYNNNKERKRKLTKPKMLNYLYNN